MNACDAYIEEHTVEGEIEVIEEEHNYSVQKVDGLVEFIESWGSSKNLIPAETSPNGKVFRNIENKEPCEFVDRMPKENNYVLPEEAEFYERDLKAWRIRHNLDVDQAAEEATKILHQAGIDVENEALNLYNSIKKTDENTRRNS